ncbi:MAG TPA: hypothetical protein VJV79_23300 [Polyangiaceae bacterium]|nr:hypothetical protein [Polyangiaceae bacterium]
MPAASAPAPRVLAPAPVPSAPVAPNAPDIVRLRNGGILRGMISELLPGDYVTLVLITGETRKVPYVDVQYAGAANAEPGAPTSTVAPTAAAAPIAAASAIGSTSPSSTASGATQPFAVVHAKESMVRVVSPRDGVTLFRRSASAGFNGGGAISGYDEVCTAPCSVSMPAGTHTFAVAKPRGKPREADPVMLPAGNATMTVSVIDRTAVRVVLGVIGVAGMVAGTAMIASESSELSMDKNYTAAFVITALGGGLFGLAFGIPDGATVNVRADAPAGNPAGNGSTAWLDNRPRDTTSLRDRLTGATLRFRF